MLYEVITSAKLASIMLSENEAKPFMQQLLSSLANFTDSQMASVYLLSDDEQQFKLFESLGLNDEAPTFFSAIKPQGEFAKVLNTYEIHHVITSYSIHYTKLYDNAAVLTRLLGYSADEVRQLAEEGVL